MSSSPKKEKSLSKPPKDKKQTKDKDTKSKKSKETGQKKAQKKSVKDTGRDDKSKKSKQKSEMNESQSDISFLKSPMFLQQPPEIDESICQFHKEKNILFCELCDQPGCQNCTIFGPHNSQMHKVSKLEECYKARYLYLNELVCGGLINKRDRLNKQMEQLNNMCQEIRYNKYGIQKITKIEFNETIDRLRGSFGGKLAVLHHEMAELQKDLEAINALGSEFFDLTSMNPETYAAQSNPKGMIPFLLRTKYLQDEAENLISKPIKTSIEIYPYDLPREVAQRKLLIQSNQTNQDIIAFKNQVIWRLVEERKAQSNAVVEQFYQQANEQCEQWTKLTNKLKEQLQVFKMACSFCGCPMLPNNVNEMCEKNKNEKFEAKIFTTVVPPAEQVGTGYHYFEHPNI